MAANPNSVLGQMRAVAAAAGTPQQQAAQRAAAARHATFMLRNLRQQAQQQKAIRIDLKKSGDNTVELSRATSLWMSRARPGPAGRTLQSTTNGGGPPGGGGGGGGGGGRGGGGRMSRAGGAITAAAGGLVAAGVAGVFGLVTSQFSDAVEAYASTLKSQRGIGGMISKSGLDQTLAAGSAKGFDPQETIDLVSAVGKAVGSKGPGAFPSDAVAAAQQAQKDYGLDTGQSAGIMGKIRQAGQSFGPGGGGTQVYRKLLIDAQVSGLEKSRVAEHMANVSNVMDDIGASLAGDVDSGAASQQMASLGALGSGFQGERGLSTFKALQQAGTQGAQMDLSPDAEAFMLRAFGYGKPGSQNTLHEARLGMAKGFSDPDFVKKIVGEAIAQKGQSVSGGADMLSQLGVSYDKATALITAGLEGFPDKAAFDKLVTELTPPDYQKEISEFLKQGAELQQKAYDMGREQLPGVMDIKAAAQKLASELLPAVVAALGVITGLLENISEVASWVRGFFGGDAPSTAVKDVLAAHNGGGGENFEATQRDFNARIAALEPIIAEGKEAHKRSMAAYAIDGPEGSARTEQQAAIDDAAIVAANRAKKDVAEMRKASRERRVNHTVEQQKLAEGRALSSQSGDDLLQSTQERQLTELQAITQNMVTQTRIMEANAPNHTPAGLVDGAANMSSDASYP